MLHRFIIKTNFITKPKIEFKMFTLAFTLMVNVQSLACAQSTRQMHNELDNLLEDNSKKPLVRLHSISRASYGYSSSTASESSGQSGYYPQHSSYSAAYSRHSRNNSDIIRHQSHAYPKSYRTVSSLPGNNGVSVNSVDDLKEDINYAKSELDRIHYLVKNFKNQGNSGQADTIKKINEANQSIQKIAAKSDGLAAQNNSSQVRLLNDYANNLAKMAAEEYNSVRGRDSIDTIPDLP